MPQLDDDGQAVTLDLHGATVDEALALTLRTVQLAEARGRMQLKIIHGSSTTQHFPARRTIKRALHNALDDGALHPHAATALRRKDYLLLALDVTAAHDPTPIRLRDVY